MSDHLARLTELGLTLPPVVPPVAAYQPAIRSGAHVYVSGQVPMVDGKLPEVGPVDTLELERAQELARICALNGLAAIDALVGLNAVVRIVKVTGYVAASDVYTDHPKVINGASELLGEVFGEAGRHARAAVGVSSLPMGAPVEVDMIAEVS
ncbi:RidA family protein [Stackebrandtia nassauensis]|uniref:Endoribonuclease L-PSP n=1 Tax=Stackebrandtia nassauensis (strain DSM 44728 / CIP 108903 / NRRL B-16338 / NBRC 102104 / LLR-40K-21) TaxID=446470 RepID=D3QA60_STANL|nr:RidA family protein [Stackebrandtia nassauensis]ADD40772.1 Endoribonuclease L-PSP [Stackebrandtia nassauensis DSM 44728]